MSRPAPCKAGIAFLLDHLGRSFSICKPADSCPRQNPVQASRARPFEISHADAANVIAGNGRSHLCRSQRYRMSSTLQIGDLGIDREREADGEYDRDINVGGMCLQPP